MQLSSRFTGAKCKPLTITVTPRMIMNYAAAIDDPNPWHYDDERPEGLVAPPMMANALTWAASSNVEDHWEADGFPVETMARKVHYLEILEMHRPMRPGETLRLRGKLAAILPHRRARMWLSSTKLSTRIGKSCSRSMRGPYCGTSSVWTAGRARTRFRRPRNAGEKGSRSGNSRSTSITWRRIVLTGARTFISPFTARRRLRIGWLAGDTLSGHCHAESSGA